MCTSVIAFLGIRAKYQKNADLKNVQNTQSKKEGKKLLKIGRIKELWRLEVIVCKDSRLEIKYLRFLNGQNYVAHSELFYIRFCSQVFTIWQNVAKNWWRKMVPIFCVSLLVLWQRQQYLYSYAYTCTCTHTHRCVHTYLTVITHVHTHLPA